MKGINVNKTVLAVAIAATLSIGIVGCDGVSSKTDVEHVAAAKDYLDKDDTKSGVVELKSALQKNPNNAEARRLLGELNLEVGNGAAAEKELKRAIELGVAKEAIIASLAEALAIQGKYQEILDQIEAPANVDPVEKAEIISYRGDAWFSKRKPEKARTEYERALEIDAESGRAKLGLAKLAVASKKSDEAGQLITEALQSSPEDSDIWLFQAELQRAKGEIGKAEESYGQAIKLNKRNLVARYQRALLRVGKRDFDGAGKDIEALKEEAPKSFQRHYAEGLLAFFQKQFPEAEAALNESLKLNGNFIQAIFYRGSAHLAQNHLVQAENDLRRVYAVAPNVIKSRQLLAQVRFQQKEFVEAKALLEPVIRSRPEDLFTLNLMGNIEFALGNNDEGMEYLQKLAELRPEDASVHARLGLGMLKSGEREKGIQQLELAGDLAPKFSQGDAFIVMSYLQSKEFDKAEKVIAKIKTKQPDSPLSGNMTGMLYQAKKDPQQAKKAFESVLMKFPGNSAASNALADIALKEKDYVAVRKLYTTALANHPSYLNIQLRLAALNALEGKLKDMEVLLVGAIEDHPKVLQPRLILSEYYIRSGQAGRAQTLLEEVKGLYKNNPQLLSVLFKAQLADKNETRALETVKQLTELTPESAQAQFMLAKAYEVKRDSASVRRALTKTLELAPKHVGARMAMVKSLMFEGDSSAAAEMLNSLVDDYPNKVDVMSLQGWFAQANSDFDGAVAIYQKVFEKQLSVKTAIILAQLKWKSGKQKEAVDSLVAWCDEHTEDVEARYALARFYTVEGKHNESIKELVKIVELQPDNILALNDLAWKLRKEESQKALEYAERAYEKAPKSSRILDTLAMVLIENGQLERGLSLQERAVKLSPSSSLLKYHLAIILERNGQKVKAVQTLRELLNNDEKFNKRTEAEALLKVLSK